MKSPTKNFWRSSVRRGLFIGVSRLQPRNPTASPGIRLRFIGLQCPEEVRAGFERIKIRPWQQAPLMCRTRRCASYGHTNKRCRAAEPRYLRCSGAHPADDCNQSSAALCPHCGAGHAACDHCCLLDFSLPVLVPENKTWLENSDLPGLIAMYQSIVSGMHTGMYSRMQFYHIG